MAPTTDQLAALRAAATAAHQPGVFWYEQDMLERFTKHFTGAEADATYISAASPAAVLSLIAHIDAQAERLAKQELLLAAQQAEHNINDWPAWKQRVVGRDPGFAARVAELERDAARYRRMTGAEAIDLASQITETCYLWGRPCAGAKWALILLIPGNSRGIEYGMRSWEFAGPICPPEVT
ncbi:Ead/Ea22-like family protein [Chromobacterium violaceum]|uniref:hypothetical protein n=1 Tax=Chromobacterium violaceum TaxID=536 RepID=UPI003CEFDB47